MNNVSTLLMSLAMLLPAAKDSTARAATMALTPPLYDQDFSAESTLSDRGRLIFWRYHASSMLHTTEYFGQVPTMEATVTDPVVLRQYWLNLETLDLVKVLTSSTRTENDVSRLAPNTEEYRASLESMRAIMANLIRLDARNAKLESAVEFLKNLE